MEGYGQSNYITGLDSGTIDASGVTNGLIVERTHLTRVTNTNIINAKTIGIKIAKSNNISSDTWVENIYIHGTGDTAKTTGQALWVDGYDNNILMMRSAGFHTGIYISGGGNFFKNCHPLYGVGAENLDYYESSVAFHIKAGDNQFEQCYNDNFSIGFLQDGNYDWNGVQLFNYWYENYNYKHTWLKVANADFFRGRIYGLLGSLPSKGQNRILIRDEGKLHQYNLGSKPDTAGLIQGLVYNDTAKIYNYWTDEAYKNNILNIQHYDLYNWEYQIQENTWYPFLFATTDTYVQLEVDLTIGQGAKLHLNLGCNENGYTINSVEGTSDDGTVNEVDFGVSKFTWAEETTRKLAVLWFKIKGASTTGGVGVQINGGSVLGSKLCIPPRNLNEHYQVNNKIAESEDNPITTILTVMNIEKHGYRGFSGGNNNYKTNHTIPLKSANETVILDIHYENYNFTYLIKVFNSQMWKVDLLQDTSSTGHEPTITYDNTLQQLDISMSNTGIIKYFIL